jgi:hypothetical protein
MNVIYLMYFRSRLVIHLQVWGHKVEEKLRLVYANNKSWMPLVWINCELNACLEVLATVHLDTASPGVSLCIKYGSNGLA